MEFKKEGLSELRRRTEEKILKMHPGGIRSLPKEDIFKILNELQIYNIAAELQNEELRQKQNELEESRNRCLRLYEKYSNLYNLAAVGYFTLTEKKEILETNFAGASMLGKPKTSLLGLPLTRFIHSDSQNIFCIHCLNAFKTKTPQTCEIQIKRSDDSLCRVHLKTIAATDREKKFTLLIAMTRLNEHNESEFLLKKAHEELEKRVEERTAELTAANEQLKHENRERLRAEQVLKQNEKFIKSVIDSLPDHIAVVDDKGDIIAVNRAWENFAFENQAGPDKTGVGENYFDACMNAFETGECEFVEKILSAIQKILSRDLSHFEIEYPCHSPLAEGWFMMRVSPLESEHGGVVISHTDITASKKVAQQLYESESIFATFMEHLPGTVFIKNKDLCYIYVNRLIFEKFGGEKWLGKFPHDIFPKDYAEQVIKDDRKALSEGVQEIVYHLPDQKGETHVYKALKFPIFRGEKPPLLGGIGIDITRQVKAESLRHESEALLRATLESTSDGILVMDRSGRIILANSRFSEIWKIPEKLLRTRDNMKLVQHVQNQLKDPEGYLSEIQKLRNITEEACYILLFKDGRTVEQISYPLIRNREAAGRVASFRDITRDRGLQEQLIRSERLAATGQLAVSVAHEINSPLQAATVMLTTLREKYKSNTELSEEIDLLKEAFLDIRGTVKNLLDLNRPGKQEKQLVNINIIIEKTVKLLYSLMKKHNIRICLNLSDVPDITASPQQISQVLMNLINNAIESISGMPSAKASVTREIDISTALRGKEIEIRVADTGSGISEHDMNHIFDPFYTTRKKMGMGIGLSVCHGIIEDHFGSVTAKNLPGRGAVFIITLPAA
jgi:PAS domain S-box-containing protein